jgi:hypothetical protein
MVTVVAVLAVAVAAGAIIQGSMGFGYALVAVPAMVLQMGRGRPLHRTRTHRQRDRLERRAILRALRAARGRRLRRCGSCLSGRGRDAG